ncbi:MAG: glycosyltransferase family 2 protein [Candidatus Saccharimonadales bacterium]
MKYDATVALLTFNGELYLEELLKAVFNQKTDKKYEVLVIDSGSTDRTLEIVSKFPEVRLHQIPNTEFGHGKTRNLAVEMAKGDFVLFLTQDAVPSYEKWLDYMIEPFSIGDTVSCVFGKQIPRPDCFATLKREVATVFKSLGSDGSIVLHRQTKLTDRLGITNTFFSDANSAVRKSTMRKIPFRDLNYAEDQALGIDMLAAGYIKAYAPLGSVNHSHNYPLRQYFKRKFDESVGLRNSTGQTPMAGRKELVIGSFKATLQDYRFILRDKDYSFVRKLHDFALAPFYNILLRVAIRAAANEKEAAKKHEKYSLEAAARRKK